MDQTVSLRDKHSQETRAALVAAARKLFAERGYHNVGVREFAATAGVTRGALYHHFKDKEAIFLAVVEVINGEKKAAAAQRHRDASRPDRWTQLRRDLQIALDDAANDPEFQQIRIIDAPAVFGWERWRALDSHHGLAAIAKAIEKSIEDGLIAPQPVLPLTHLIAACMNEASMLIAHAKEPEKTRAEAGKALDALLEGLQRHKAGSEFDLFNDPA